MPTAKLNPLPIHVTPEAGGFRYRIGEGLDQVSGWTRSKDYVRKLVDGYEHRRTGRLSRPGRAKADIQVSNRKAG